MPPSFSIVINTLNRGSELQKTLESFRWLKYSGEFEVVVVNGPSTDDSDKVIRSWGSQIRAEKCDLANLSVSRNIGICMAQGDIIVFIDDDAIPEPEWLSQLAEAYEDPMVGAVGGLVFNHTGYDFQYEYCLVDRFGNADLSPSGPTPHLSFPKSQRFPHLLGCNSSFRRSALLEIGGFDEEYEYFLDETDVCLRIVDAGYIISQLPCAYVHHKFAPSNIRGNNKIVQHRYPIIKNKIYFMLKNAREFYPLDRVLKEQDNFIQDQRRDINWAIGEKLLAEDDLISFEQDVEKAISVGLQRGIEGVANGAMIDENKLKTYSGEFSPFRPIENKEYRTIVLISKDFPPNHGGGIATFNKDLAEALAIKGNIVHIVTQSPDINRVDFEKGVWVHRMVIRDFELSSKAMAKNIPQHIWNWSATAFEETKRIATHRTIDVVEVPIWDCEGISFILNKKWPLVTSLQTTLHFWLQSHFEQKNDEQWMKSFGKPMLALEKEQMLSSNAIRSISLAIKHEIESAYDFHFDDKKVCVAPLGMPDEEILSSDEGANKNALTILFVGRLEHRKGIDILLEAIPMVLEKKPKVLFRIIGDDTLLKPSNEITYKEEYLSSKSGQQWIKQVKFEGRVNDDVLQKAYETSDIFVAPSRFESFGLVFLEAMRKEKPVIGCLSGGMPELILNNLNGLLIEPGNANDLTEAILLLAGSETMRKTMGKAGKKLFQEKFTSECMEMASIGLYDLAKINFEDETIT